MADASKVFYDTVFGSLVIAEAELRKKDFDQDSVRAAVDELARLSREVSRRHFGVDHWSRHRHVVGEYFPIVQRLAEKWYKKLSRRMSFRCGVLHPWRVLLSENLPRELFSVVCEVVSRTGFGLIEEQVGDTTVLAFTSRTRVRNLFCDLLGRQIRTEVFLTRKAQGQKRVEALVETEKQFCITYNAKKEEIYFEFFYGSWNEHGWSQHE